MRNRKQTQAQRIAAYVRRRKTGATRRELSERLGIVHQSVGPRVVELLNNGTLKEINEYRDGCRVLVSTWRK